MSEPVDLHVVAALKELGGEDDPGLFGELLDTFVSDTPARLAAMEAALQGGDGRGLAEAAHCLKSSAANMGAHGLAELCRRLEAAGKEGRTAGARDLFEAAQREYHAAVAILDSLRG